VLEGILDLHSIGNILSPDFESLGMSNRPQNTTYRACLAELMGHMLKKICVFSVHKIMPMFTREERSRGERE
jgi:hypothetical protein